MASQESTQYYSISGELLFERPGSRPLWSDRSKIARLLGVCDEQLHFHLSAPAGGAQEHSVAVCPTFKVLCEECSDKMDCSCRSTERTCPCVEAQSTATHPWNDERLDARNLCHACFWGLDVATPPYEREATFYEQRLGEEEGRQQRWKSPNKPKDRKIRLGKDFFCQRDEALD